MASQRSPERLRLEGPPTASPNGATTRFNDSNIPLLSTRIDLLPSTKIWDLPNELLLRVTKELHTKDLVSLARVNKRFAGIAQDILYREIIFPSPKHPKELARISLLLYTVLKRPNLASKIHSLGLWATTDLINASLSELPSCSASTSFIHPTTRIQTSYSWLSGLLHYVPCLRTLSIGVYQHDKNSPGHAKAQFPSAVLGELFKCTPEAVIKIPGLDNLRSISPPRSPSEPQLPTPTPSHHTRPLHLHPLPAPATNPHLPHDPRPDNGNQQPRP
ncbi:hypothetical protein CC80DRAFT_538430 [Byssothecium circinans]|uniref:F-box domain-containing protein n=1 Tax=Byssothecium circinans TaxID=147558 RepID=A0A6A5TKJ3_9PLEO|nr:hypothetical protein CC80DRAFT_538430 [Byssothecium circinans]